VFLNSFM